MFDLWRINYLGIPAVTLILSLRGLAFGQSLMVGFLVLGVVSILLLLRKYSKITRRGNKITISTPLKTITLDNIDTVDTWWEYDFGKSTTEMGSGDMKKMRAHANKINVILEIRSKFKSVFLYEQIYMSSKFPNNHEYVVGRNVDYKQAIRIWDIDKCIKELKLDQKKLGH